ncbi:MAG TPA: PGPGW domain-containing protein [Nocardioides sp.]|nr:PGPGW domain-containing protein [Nocardioides sp.]
MAAVDLSPRSQALLDSIDGWAHRGGVRRALVRVGVTVGGPLVVVAGIAMLVLPGPGLVVIALGMALLALEYAWARTVLVRAGHGAAWVRRAVLPPDGGRGRRLLGVASAGAFVVATTLLTGAVTTYVGAQTFL